MDEFCTYEEFGRRFFAHAVTAERIVASLGGLVGNEIAFGPKGVGPAQLAKVRANGAVGQAAAVRDETDPLTFRLTIPVDLRFAVQLAGMEHRFTGVVLVGIDLTARAALPLRIVIDITPPTSKDVQVALKADGLAASVFQLVAGVDDELRRFIAKYVAREVEKESVRKGADVDIAARIDAAWRH